MPVSFKWITRKFHISSLEKSLHFWFYWPGAKQFKIYLSHTLGLFKHCCMLHDSHISFSLYMLQLDAVPFAIA